MLKLIPLFSGKGETLIRMSAVASVTDPVTGQPVTDPAILTKLDGAICSRGDCIENMAGPILDDLDVSGGVLQLAVAMSVKTVRVMTEYVASTKLEKAQLDALVDYTQAQWSDGIGSEAFRDLEKGLGVRIDVFPFGSSKTFRVDQLAAPARPDATPRKRRSIQLFKAIHAGDLEGVKAAIEAGESIEDRRESATPLKVAVGRGFPEAVEFLLEKGADVEAADSTGNTPLSTCAQSHQVSDEDAAMIAGILLDHRAQINRMVDGYSTLELAIRSEKPRLAELLKSRGAIVPVRSYTYQCCYPIRILDRKSNEPLMDPTVLGGLHQKTSPIQLTDYMHEVLLDQVSITRGEMMILYQADANPPTRMQITFHVERDLSAEETETLRLGTVKLLHGFIGGRMFKEFGLRVSPPKGPELTGAIVRADEQIDRLEFANELFAAIDADKLDELESASARRKKLEARKFGLTPLLWALSKGKTAAASRLFDMGADPKAVSRVDGAGTIVLCAAHPTISDDAALVLSKAFHSKGADLNLKVGNDKTSLILARAKKKVKLAAWLLMQGAV